MQVSLCHACPEVPSQMTSHTFYKHISINPSKHGGNRVSAIVHLTPRSHIKVFCPCQPPLVAGNGTSHVDAGIGIPACIRRVVADSLSGRTAPTIQPVTTGPSPVTRGSTVGG